jgi:hypothetical protein
LFADLLNSAEGVMLNSCSREASRVHNHEIRRHLTPAKSHGKALSLCSFVSSVVKIIGGAEGIAVRVCGGVFHLTGPKPFL